MGSLMRKVSLFCAAVFVIEGCGTGSGGEAVRPEAPKASAVLGEKKCTDAKAPGEPLVVDWTGEERANLEIAMRSGVALVSYDCNTIRLLDCVAQGDYRFFGVSAKEQVISLSN